jgi:hypothetical protein
MKVFSLEKENTSGTSSKRRYGLGLGKKMLKEIKTMMPKRPSSNSAPFTSAEQNPSTSSQGSVEHDSYEPSLVEWDAAAIEDPLMSINRSLTPSSRTPISPAIHSGSTSTLVGSALERKVQEDVEFSPEQCINTTERLADLRVQMDEAGIDC